MVATRTATWNAANDWDQFDSTIDFQLTKERTISPVPAYHDSVGLLASNWTGADPSWDWYVQYTAIGTGRNMRFFCATRFRSLLMDKEHAGLFSFIGSDENDADLGVVARMAGAGAGAPTFPVPGGPPTTFKKGVGGATFITLNHLVNEWLVWDWHLTSVGDKAALYVTSIVGRVYWSMGHRFVSLGDVELTPTVSNVKTWTKVRFGFDGFDQATETFAIELDNFGAYRDADPVVANTLGPGRSVAWHPSP